MQKKIMLTVFLISIIASYSMAVDSDLPQEISFRFAVLGDNRPGGESDPILQPEPYHQAIKGINLLSPDFVVVVGDLIRGYNPDAALINREWDEFDRVTQGFQMPYYLVVGNHDVWDKASEDIYKQRYGKLYYSFDYQNSHFIVLDSDIAGEMNFITGAQLEWLKKDLEANRQPEHLFVFLHKPLWKADYDRNWNAEIHQLMAKYRVDIVFAGHEHWYRKSKVQDGVKYIITGGAGAPVSGTQDEGGFFHWTHVLVKGKQVTLAVIRTEGVLSEEGKILPDWAKVNWVEKFSFGTASIDAANQPPFTEQIQIQIKNPLRVSVKGQLEWKLLNGWQVMPQHQTYSIDPNSEVNLNFKVTANEKTKMAYPLPSYKATFVWAEGEKPIVRGRELRLIKRLVCKKREQAIAADGNPDDWQGLEPLRLNRQDQAMYRSSTKAAYSQGWEGPDDLSADIYLAWDDDFFYFAAVVQDNLFCQQHSNNSIWRGDSIQLAFDTLNDNSKSPDDNDYEYGIALSPDGPLVKRWFAPSNKTRGDVPTIKLSVTRQPDQNRCIYEAAIPWSDLSPLKPKSGTVCGFNVIVNDNDGEGREGWIEWTPGIAESKDTSYFGDLVLE